MVIKITLSLIALLLLPVGSWAACTGSSPSWSCGPTYTELNNLINNDNPGIVQSGDTINVSADPATWTSKLDISKGINLIGAGIGNTVITNNIGSEQYLIAYNSPSNSAYFRVSGFTFDLNDNKALFVEPSSEPTVALIRIDHNRFTNSSASGSCVFYKGAFGVIDNNVIDDIKYPFRTDAFSGATWTAYDDDFWGTSLSMYIEDNVIDFQGSGWPISDSDFGGRYVIRYNTVKELNGAHYSLTDVHGGRGQYYGAMGAEVYGNYVDAGSYQIHLGPHRGGRATIHHNNIIDTDDPVVKIYSHTCPTGEPIERQKHNNSYHFQNREDTTGTLVRNYTNLDDCGSATENSRYWMDNTDCIGGCSSVSSGVGCGSTLPATCTPSADVTKGSTAFWLTNQSCTSLSGLTGASTEVRGGNRNPSSIIEGTLYVCTATDTWTAWYTPLTYPHPLRVDTTPTPTTPPTPPTPTPTPSPPYLRIVE